MEKAAVRPQMFCNYNIGSRQCKVKKSRLVLPFPGIAPEIGRVLPPQSLGIVVFQHLTVALAPADGVTSRRDQAPALFLRRYHLSMEIGRHFPAFRRVVLNVLTAFQPQGQGVGRLEPILLHRTQLQTRPLIYPSELQKLNNKESTGNAIIVTFGNFPLKTKYTPSYLCPLYQFGEMDLTDVRSNVFYADRVFYDITRRNKMMLPDRNEGAG